ncbi:MAG: ABC transporter six-transmembrane domain-containing protein [Pelagimonas sp.]|uniref:ABC transporter six-transmembrane domain-containing protein n=1 Tax=Pelagimonas sp. TaxID=2073170 RepID=UPI003D6C0911
MLEEDGPITIPALLRVFWRRIGLTWVLTLFETALTALVPLFIGFAIDGLLAQNTTALFQLITVMAVLIAISVARRAYDTRVFGTVRVEVGRAQAARAPDQPVSMLNARLSMGREIVDFLEGELPLVIAAVVQLVISMIVLFAFGPMLALAGAVAVVAMLMIYALFHRRFYRLNGHLNQQTERQVGILETRNPRGLLLHLSHLRRVEVRLSDSESILYGAIFIVLLGLVVFNLWYATTTLPITTGTIFSIVSYSWEFIESALALPVTLQGWSRLSEITKRINLTKKEKSARSR